MKDAGRISFRTNAKVNLFLRVLGRRPDGFHELESVFHGVGLFDELHVELTRGSSVDVEFEPIDPSSGPLPDPECNSLRDVVSALRSRGIDLPGLRINVRKAIPLGSGLGGGSANAAGLIVALNELCDLRLGKQEMHAVAESVGSDVPYCLSGGTAMVTGRGEKIQAIPSSISLSFVLGISNAPLSTADVYSRFDELEAIDSYSSAPLIHALGSGDVSEIASFIHNDLETAAIDLRPGIAMGKATMIDAGAIGVGMSGSGPTVFAIAADPDLAWAIARSTREKAFDRAAVVQSSDRGVEFL